MDDVDRRSTLWALAALLALPFLLGPRGLARALPSAEGGKERPGPVRPRVTPPDRSVKRHG